MKKIEIDDELYRYIASETRHIGESASDILRRLLKLDAKQPVQPVVVTESVQAPVVKQDADLKPVAPAKIRSVKCVNCCYLIVMQRKQNQLIVFTDPVYII